MPSKTPPLSIRPRADRLARVQAWATDHGLSQHAAVLALIDLGLAGKAEALPTAPRAEAAPPKRERPISGAPFRFQPVDALTGKPLDPPKPYQKGSKR